MDEKLLDEKEKAIVNALRENPELKKCFLEMIDITHCRIEELTNGDDAEEAVVTVIQKTGKTLLQDWVGRQQNRMERIAKENRSLRPHGKKK